MSLNLAEVLRAAAWVVAAWFAVSVVAAVVITGLFRAQARRNELLTADGRRRDWASAADAVPGAPLAHH